MSAKKRSDAAKAYVLKSWRDYPPMNVSLGTMLHNRTGSWRFIKPIYEDKVPACQNACPAGNDIEGWIKLLQQGEYKKAYWHVKREEPFPAVLGRVCFKFCESACNRTPLDQSVGIRELERFAGDQVPLSTPHPELPEYNGKTIAIVGSGPAGMSAAYYGRLLGFKVTIFEALPKMGGILRVGIPSYRLPREIIEAEFKALEAMGIQLKPDTPIGKAVSIIELTESFDYLFLATGVHASRKLHLEGEDRSPRIMSGLSMLKKVALGEEIDLGKKVAVIGGGNTAVDAARTAVRMGCQVTIIYRRSEAEMPAHPEEIEEALDEGITLRTLAAPESIELAGDGAIKALTCCAMELGPPDESGRRRPIKREGALFEVKTDSILTAIGEAPLFRYLEGRIQTEEGLIVVDEALRVQPLAGHQAGIFAGGDITPVPHTVVHAVATGKKAAVAMDCDRQGLDFSRVLKEIAVGDAGALSFSAYRGWAPVNPVKRDNQVVIDTKKIQYDYLERVSPVKREIKPRDARKTSFESYTRTLTEEEMPREADRCIHCGRCTECDNCLIFCPDMSVLIKGEGGFGYTFDYDYCKGCGVCFNECPRNAITMVDEETAIDIED